MRLPILAAVLVSGIGPARAHIELASPTPRTAAQKDGPCGAVGSVRGDDVTLLPAGGTVELRWDETIDHPGHFRISFDEDGQDGFVDPAGYDDLDSAPTVLLDGIEDRDGGGIYTASITLPDLECTTCTLQLIQVMTDKPPYGDGNDIYYQCADVELTHDPIPDAGGGGDPDAGAGEPGAADAGGGPSTTGGTGGCAAGGGGPDGAGLAALGLALARGARRRRRTAGGARG
jgi:MYXO-CTERM domain-containing protein